MTYEDYLLIATSINDAYHAVIAVNGVNSAYYLSGVELAAENLASTFALKDDSFNQEWFMQEVLA